MSSTNVHSENLTCAAAQMIPTEKSVEIPPKTAKMGPTRMSVILSDYIEIPVENSVLDKKSGNLVDKNGNLVAQFKQEQVKKLEKQREARAKLQGRIVEKSAGQEK